MNVKEFDIGYADYSHGIRHHHCCQHDNKPLRRRMLAWTERHGTGGQALVVLRRSLDWPALLVHWRRRSECALRVRAHIATVSQTRATAFAQFAISRAASGDPSFSTTTGTAGDRQQGRHELLCAVLGEPLRQRRAAAGHATD